METKINSAYEFEQQPLLLLTAFQMLVERWTFLRDFHPILKPEHWSEIELSWIVAQCIDHYDKYGDSPGLKTLRMRLDADLRPDAEEKKLIRRLIDKLDTFDTDQSSRDYCRANFENFIKYRATLYAVHEAQAFIREGEMDMAVQVVQDSQKVRLMKDNWLTLPGDCDRFFEFFNKETMLANTVPMDMPPLDKKLKGGAKRKEMNVIVAPLGYGKSQFLVHIGSAAVRHGKNVVHFSFENSEEETLARYMYNLLSINSDILQEYDITTEHYQSRLEDFKAMGAQVKIMRLIGSQTTCIDLAGYLERLIEGGWIPDVVIVDYGDLMAAARRSSHQSKKYEELQTVFEELRDLATQFNIVMWTAAQANREGMMGKRVLTHHIADALGKAFTADVIITMSKEQKEAAGTEITDDDDEEEAPDNGIRILHIVKLRRGGSDNKFCRAKTRYAQARLVSYDWEDSPDDIGEPSGAWKQTSRRKADDDATQA